MPCLRGSAHLYGPGYRFLLWQTAEAACHGQAGPGQQLTVEEADGEYFITCGHEMTKEHFISFLAVLTGDSLLMKKLYPEWAMQARVPCTKSALLVWYCTQHGLFCQPLRPGTPPQAR